VGAVPSERQRFGRALPSVTDVERALVAVVRARRAGQGDVLTGGWRAAAAVDGAGIAIILAWRVDRFAGVDARALTVAQIVRTDVAVVRARRRRAGSHAREAGITLRAVDVIVACAAVGQWRVAGAGQWIAVVLGARISVWPAEHRRQMVADRGRSTRIAYSGRALVPVVGTDDGKALAGSVLALVRRRAAVPIVAGAPARVGVHTASCRFVAGIDGARVGVRARSPWGLLHACAAAAASEIAPAPAF